MKLLIIVINIGLAIWVHSDAKKFRQKGVSVIPGLWSTAYTHNLIWGCRCYSNFSNHRFILEIRNLWTLKQHKIILQPIVKF